MKTSKFKYGLLYVATSLIILACNPPKPAPLDPCPPATQVLASSLPEDVLWFCVKQLPEKEADAQIKLATDSLCDPAEAPLNSLAMELPATLADEIQKIAGAIKVDAATPAVLNAAQLHYAFDSNNKFICYIEPVVLARTGKGRDAENKTFGTYNLKSAPTQNFYLIENGKLQLKDQQIALTDIKNYKEYNKSTGKCLAATEPFVTSMLITAQELKEIIKSNAGSTKVNFYHAIKSIQQADNTMLAHHFILSTDKPGTPTSGNNLTGKYSNLSHMCPPSCNVDNFAFQLE